MYSESFRKENSMNIAVLRETQEGEARVALVPDSVRKLAKLDVSGLVESGAGELAGIADADYTAAGAVIMNDRAAVVSQSTVLAAVNRPPNDVLCSLQPGTAIIGFVRPLDEPEALQPALDNSLTTFAMELMPRITRAQAMDALSSMATIAGYKAVIVAASRLPRMFPLLMTAASTVRPARVLVLGAGVAGLQAIATARRLGAVVEAYDVRAAGGEQVRSLGASFIEVDLGGIETEGGGGYAAELTLEALQRGRDAITERAANADIVITSAQVPGKRAPLMLTKAAVAGMRAGSIVVDLAGATGGNCEVTQPGEDIVVNGVHIWAPLNIAATVPAHASQLYSNNVAAFLNLIVKDGALHVDLEDDVVGPACATHMGQKKVGHWKPRPKL
jgi:NAD(P) transhydrogenase subunit alpha